MQVLVTGSNGFIGSHLVEKLVSKKYNVFCLIRKSSDLKWIEHLPVKFVYGDIIDYNSLIPVVKQMDYVYHLGGIVRARTEAEFERVNCDGTRNLLEACRLYNAQLKRFVFVSSQAAAGPSPNGIPLTEDKEPHPISAYGRSKLKAEAVVMNYADFFPVTIIRPPSVYGSRDDAIFVIFKMIKYRLKPLVGWKEKKISLVHIDDLVRGICLAAEHPQAENQKFFIVNPAEYDWLEMMNLISRIMKKKAMVVRIPELLLDVMAWFNEKLSRIFNYDAVLNMEKAWEMKQNYWLISNSKAKKLLGFEPKVELEDGIEKTVDWYKNQGWL